MAWTTCVRSCATTRWAWPRNSRTAIERHVEGYACEWKGVLEDPDKLSRFVSFVNAPEVADPTVEFTEQCGPQGATTSECRRYEGSPKMTLLNDIQVWTAACAYDYLIPNRGVGVLLPDGAQAALFRLDDGSLHAVGNIDPFSGAAVMSRGIVGDRGGRATVQSPIKKQAFALDDGSCLDDPGGRAAGLPDARHRRRPASRVGVPGLFRGMRQFYVCARRATRRNRLAISRTNPGWVPSGSVTTSAPLVAQPVLKQAIRQQV